MAVSRLTPAFTATRVTAPTIPPSSELSLPMTAFCTTLDKQEDDDEVERIHRGQPAFAGQPEQHHQQGIHYNCADHLLRQRNLFDEHVVPHVNPFASPLKAPNRATGQANQTTPGKSISGVSR